MKVTIIGTNGFLSIALATYYTSNKCELNMYGLDKPRFHQYNKFHAINLIKEELDYDDFYDSDIIIYATGAGIQSNIHDSNDSIYLLNTIVPIKICNGLKKIAYKGVFVTFGSYFEIGETSKQKPYTEIDVQTSTAFPPNEYTLSKRMLTRFVSSYKHSYTHWHFILPTIYGETENPTRLIPYTINAIQTNQEAHFTFGNQTRQYIYIEEIPYVLNLAYKKSLPNGIYNIQGAEIMTVKDIVNYIYNAFGKEVPSNCFGTNERIDTSMEYLALDGTKLKKEIGFIPSIKLSKKIIKKYTLQL